MSLIEVLVISASNLPNLETFSKSDPYTIVEFKGIKNQTNVITAELDPFWNEKFVFDLKGSALTDTDKLSILVMDHEKVGTDRLLGQAEVSLKDLTKGKNEMTLNINLVDSNKRPNAATINLKVVYSPPKVESQIDGGGGGGGGGAGANEVDDENADENQSTLEDEAVGGTKKKRRAVKGSHRKIRKQWSTKPQDFQIRVKVFEARQLQGANISSICRVTCWNQTKQTRVKKCTNSPFFNETFFFNFNVASATLFDELISLEVFNSRQLRSDSMIGAFKFDIGMIYEEDEHCYLNKWLLLCDPEDHLAGAKGYLKISVVVLGPGDVAPSFKGLTSEDEEDIEANLLRPAGVQLRPATFVLRVFRAEDLPRMDSDVFQGIKKVFSGSEQKDLVDPYLMFHFAGKTMKTAIKYNSDHPDWNEELSIGLQFPSMCEKIKLQLFDWDRVTEDDVIGTNFIELSTVSAQGNCERDDEGFLPTFGPAFINFYGSPREFSDLPDKYDALNEGKGEGVAYRGRVLVELRTIFGESENALQSEIPPDDVQKIQKYLRRRKYRLNCAFLDATMITEVNAAVEFEVSMGIYGNKMDKNAHPSCSTTHPTNAVYDGQFYYFLPWGNLKPCCVVDSHWEDIGFRLFAVNYLLRLIDLLEASIKNIRVAQQANLCEEEQALFVITAIDNLIIALNKDFPEWEPGQSPETELDLNLKDIRKAELRNICKEAIRLREVATSVDMGLNELDNYLNQLKSLVHEPQNSLPDVIIWLISGGKRIAYHRLPAYDILYSPNEWHRGRFCGKRQAFNLKFPYSKDEEDLWQIPGQLRVVLWLGLEKEESEWQSLQTQNEELVVMAETYENEWSQLGKWTKKCLHAGRPAWSDSAGQCEILKEKIQLAEGWKWDGDWFVDPEGSMFFDKDTGHVEYLEDVYVNEARLPGNNWEPAKPHYTDVRGDPCHDLNEIECPADWEWVDDAWQVDLNRPCDEEGWEYTVEMSMGGYVPVEKIFHMCRRRRYVRKRQLVSGVEIEKTDKNLEIKRSPDDCWEYATMFTLKFHATERKMDMVRRRRWHRQMLTTKAGASCLFNLVSGEKNNLAVPRLFLSFKHAFKWHLRAYIYQARNLLAGDQNGLSDPYVRVVFHTQSQLTERIDCTLCPTWDQTLVFSNIEIYGDPETIAANPPHVVLELFDYDQLGEDEFLGRTLVQPVVQMGHRKDFKRSVLQWHNITKRDKEAGELLAAFELFLVNADEKLPCLPPRRNNNLYIVPDGIRPIMQRTGIEVLCWGVRNMKKFQLMSVSSPSIEFDIGGNVLYSDVIRNTNRNPNFAKPLLFFDVMLPKEELYMPPMNIRVRDNRQFGRKPMVGLHCQKTMDEFRVEPLTQKIDFMADIPGLAASGTPSDSIDCLTDLPDDFNSADSARRRALESTMSVDVIDEEALGGGGGEINATFEPDHFDEGTSVISDTPSMESVSTLESGPIIKKKKRRFLRMPKFLKKKTKKAQYKGDAKARCFNGKFFKMEDGSKVDVAQLDEDIDWWSKYYASLGEWHKCKKYKEMGYDVLKIYEKDLENSDDHNNFTDFCTTFEIFRGKNIDDEESDVIGEFKGTFRVYPLPEDRSETLPLKHLEKRVPDSAPVDCVIRLYIIKAVDLQPNDSNGLADPYIEVQLGRRKVNNRDTYVPNNLCPVFGRLFELKCTLPLQKDLIIRVKDYDLLSSDDVIGETVIDLENRYLSKFRATCGIQQTYCTDGPNKWRDSQKPKDILNEYCRKNYIPEPEYDGNCVVRVGRRVFYLEDFERHRPPNPHLGAPEERLALYVLNQLPIVKEHVEQRPLYSPLQPAIEQGKLHMWVDIFPLNYGEPGHPVNIKPREPKDYVLRVIVWNTKDVILEEENVMGEKMSDIYVKGWIAGIDERQETDVHYRSLDGTGNFNWRFCFPFQYLPAENAMVVRKKEHFWSLDVTEQSLPANLVLQIWDNDQFSADDFLGTLELNLNCMPAPSKKARFCSLQQLPQFNSTCKMVNLFECKRAYGYWPCYNDESGVAELTGKVEIELELITKEEADARPAGVGRDEPNENPHLEPPQRPASSFFFLSSPWKTFKFIIWKNFKKYIIGGIIITLLGLLIFLFIYATPGLLSRKMIGV